MRWILKKIDSLFGTVVAAITGLLASQLLAFIHAYLQRLGGHLNEARRGQLRGYLAFANDIEPGFLDSMKRKYGSDLIRRVLRWQTNHQP